MNEPPKKPDADGHALRIRKIGNSLGLILPRDLLAKLDLDEGDRLHVVAQGSGGFALVRHDPKFEQAMQIARRGMQVYRNALAELAK